MTYTEKVHKIYEELQTWDTELLKMVAGNSVYVDSMARDILEKDRDIQNG